LPGNPDLKEEEFVVSATHIHTGPNLWKDVYLSLTGDRSEAEEAFLACECSKMVAEAIVRAVSQAMEQLSESRIEVALARIQTGVCRRVVYKDGSAKMYGNPFRSDFLRMEGRDGGPSQFLYVYDANDRLAGIVANVPCTAQCDENAMYMSADYWGVVRSRVAEDLGKDVKVLALCRCAGDLSPHPIGDQTPMERKAGCYWGRQSALDLGNRLADAILCSREHILAVYSKDVYHAQGMREIDFPIWQVTEEEYKWALDWLDNKDNFDEQGKGKDLFDNGNAHNRKERYESGAKAQASRIYATVVGDVVLLSNPFEVYMEYADRIRMALPQQMVFDVQLSYDSMGYLPTVEAIRGGHYSANIFNCMCAPDGGEVLVEESVKLVRELTQA